MNGVNYRKRITELQEKLSEIQHRGGSRAGDKREENRIKGELEDAWRGEEGYWIKKSRVQ